MSAPNSSDRFRELQAFVEGVNNFECSDSGSDDGFVFTAVVAGGKGKSKNKNDLSQHGEDSREFGKGKVMSKGDIGKGDIGKGKSSDDPKCSNHVGNECHGIRQWFKCQHFQCCDTSKSILRCIVCGEEDLEPKIKNIMADHPMLKNARNENDVKLISIMMYKDKGKDDSDQGKDDSGMWWELPRV